MKRLIRRLAVLLAALFALIQLVPYGHGRSDPAVTAEPEWDSARTRELVVRACFDCHSRTPKRPWYSYVAPVSWLVRHDIEDGRKHLDFTAWDQPQRDADEALEVIGSGEMPPDIYTLMHPEARLDDQERNDLIQGLARSLKLAADGREDDDDHDSK